MKLLLAACALSISAVSAWKVDDRCLQEGQILVGDEVDEFFDNFESMVYEPTELDDEGFDWDDLAIYYREDQGLQEDIEMEMDRGTHNGLRGRGNQTAENSRQLQSGREFNLKLTWKQGHCWQV
jgi:hypothetical protein